MKAEIISVGTELLLGEITNTNASFIAGQLPALGIELYHISTVGDNLQRIVQNLEQAYKRADIVILTGGLGPTQDDITREAIASFLKEAITIDETCLNSLETFFRSRNIVMSPTNNKQAGIIPSAVFIPNKRGTAPGWWIEKNGKIIFTLPGPPGELKEMWSKYITKRLKLLGSGSIILSRTLKTFGLPESRVDELVGHLLTSANPTIGIYAKPDGIHLRITAKANTEQAANNLIQQIETEIRLILHDYIWGSDAETIQDVVTNLLEEQGMTIATAECNMGGLLASSISNNLGDSSQYEGGWIIPGEKSKFMRQLGKNMPDQYATMSPEANANIASIIREITGADLGLSICAISKADDTGRYIAGTVFISLDYRDELHSVTGNYPGQASQIRQRAVTAAMFELRKILSDGGKDASYH